jgi:hypothetical protein
MEIDDYGMEDEPQKMLQASIKAVLARYPGAVKFGDEAVNDSLEKFGIIKSYPQWFVKNVVTVSSGSGTFSLLAVDLSYEVASTSRYHAQVHTYHECQLYGFAKLSHALGKILIRPESLQDKFVELFVRQEVDFPKHPQFSKEFYVLAEHPQRAVRGLSKDFLDQCCLLKNIVVEISDDSMLITQQRIIAPEDTLKFCDFFEKVLSGYFSI